MVDWFFDKGWYITLLVLFLAAIAFTFVMAELTLKQTKMCIEAGYEEARTINWKLYCFGVRDGNTSVVPVATVRTELEAE